MKILHARQGSERSESEIVRPDGSLEAHPGHVGRKTGVRVHIGTLLAVSAHPGVRGNRRNLPSR
ncbi:hypothetical protein GCM10017781_42650 [Deinococcus metalli]|uniref:Transposase n=1 Tax=Deinococcus metalli TaxID=1141878 RepID=A0ABQ3JTH5_9DEIO|nr:hypothetical protein GCM10017781_42650 [Deinococcus metalli]